MQDFLYDGLEHLNWYKESFAFFDNDNTRNSLKFYELSPSEMQKHLITKIKWLYDNHGKTYFKQFELLKYPYYQWPDYFLGLLPGIGLHISMFWLSIENLSNEEQKARFMPMLRNVDFLGCYA